jgi:hypothetical protein
MHEIDESAIARRGSVWFRSEGVWALEDVRRIDAQSRGGAR